MTSTPLLASRIDFMFAQVYLICLFANRFVRYPCVIIIRIASISGRPNEHSPPDEITMPNQTAIVLLAGACCAAIGAIVAYARGRHLQSQSPPSPPPHPLPTRSGLLEIPAELRNKIYEDVLVNEFKLRIGNKYYYFFTGVCPEKDYRPGLLYANRQLHAETFPMFLNLRRISMDTRLDSLNQARSFLAKVDPRHPRAGIDLHVERCCWRELRRHGIQLAVLVYDFGHIIGVRSEESRKRHIGRGIMRCIEIGQSARNRRGNTAMKWLRKKVREELGEDVE